MPWSVCSLLQVRTYGCPAEHERLNITQLKKQTPEPFPRFATDSLFYPLCLACVSSHCSQSKYSVRINSCASENKSSLCLSVIRLQVSLMTSLAGKVRSSKNLEVHGVLPTRVFVVLEHL